MALSIFGSDYKLNNALANEVLLKNGLTQESNVLMLPYGEVGRIGAETRRLYFALALNAQKRFNILPILQGGSIDEAPQLPVTRLLSFGDCNVQCPYCKRDMQFIGDDGKPIAATRIPVLNLFQMAEAAHARGETVRFSGGDPMKFPRETLAVSEYMLRLYGASVSIAHNGTGPAWVKKMIPYLSSAAVDLKAVPEKMGGVMGITQERGKRMYELSLETQALIAEADTCLLDVRTPVFGDTPVEEMLRLATDIRKLNPETSFWTWRMYKPVQGCTWSAPEKERMFQMMAQASATMPNHWIGIRAKWERGGMVYYKNGRCVNPHEAAKIDTHEATGSGNVHVA